MQDYYDYHPTHVLAGPLALVSFVNHLTRAVAHGLASTTGLPLGLLDELVEHRLGASADTAIGVSGLVRWRETEKRELARALRRRPPGILALGEGALGNLDSLNLVLETGELVYLRLPPEVACDLASRQSAAQSASLWAEARALGGSHQESVRALFENRQFIYELAHDTLDVSGHSVIEICNQLRNRLVPAY